MRLGQLGKKASAWQAHAPAPGIRPAGSTVTNSCAPVQGTRVGQSGGYWRRSQEQLAAPGYLKRAKQGETTETEKTGEGLLKFLFLRNGVHLFKRRHRMLFCVGLISLLPKVILNSPYPFITKISALLGVLANRHLTKQLLAIFCLVESCENQVPHAKVNN